MKKNMGKLDRVVRLIIAIAVLILSVTTIIPQNFRVLGLIVPAILILTSIVRFCPMYLPFGCRTNKSE